MTLKKFLISRAVKLVMVISQQIWQAFVRFCVMFFPADCHYCKRLLTHRDYSEVCRRCVLKLLEQHRTELSLQRCFLCGVRLEKVSPKIKLDRKTSLYCRFCLQFEKEAVGEIKPIVENWSIVTHTDSLKIQPWRLPLKQTVSLFDNVGMAQKMVYDYKFNQRQSFSNFLAKIALRHYANFFKRFNFIMPVPANMSTRRQRGYCPVERIAKNISIASTVPLCRLVKRNKKSLAHQRSANKLERWSKVEQRYVYIGKESIGQLRKKETNDFHLLLIDDIVTSGATLNFIATLIKKHHPRANISSFCLLRTIESKEKASQASIDKSLKINL